MSLLGSTRRIGHKFRKTGQEAFKSLFPISYWIRDVFGHHSVLDRSALFFKTLHDKKKYQSVPQSSILKRAPSQWWKGMRKFTPSADSSSCACWVGPPSWSPAGTRRTCAPSRPRTLRPPAPASRARGPPDLSDDWFFLWGGGVFPLA